MSRKIEQLERKVVVTNLEQDNKETDQAENKTSEVESSATEEKKGTETSIEEVPIKEVPEEVLEDNATENSSEEASALPETKEDENEEEASTEAEEEVEVVEAATEEPALVEDEEQSESEEKDAVKFYTEILAKAEELAKQEDWSFVSNEFANLALHIEEGPDPSEDTSKEAIQKFNTLRGDFEEKKRAHYEELNKRKAENLEAKKELLKQFSDIINEEKWSATKEVNQIRGKWESIKVLPQGEVDALNDRFGALMEEFESHKVDRLVKKLQKEEENLTLKLVILEKMDALNEKVTADKADFDELNKEFHDLLIQWRKVGRVPVEKNQQAWDHFNEAQDTFSQLRFKHDKEYRKSVEKSLEKKKKLIKEAEALLDEKDIAIAARRVNKLHNQWKKTGNLPQKEENELWEKFKAATDAFNEKKSENIDVLRDQEQENLEKKLKLIEQAEAVQETEDFEEGHQAMQKLMGEWKKIGPVPRKKSSKIWKKFKGAMDVFYDNRRDHFKDVRKDHKENLAKKNELIGKLKELSEGDDPALAVEEAKKIQAEFKKIGHVPIKFKNKIWKQYREVCDVIYDRYRSSGSDLGMERKLASEGIEPADRKEIIKYQKELDSLKKEISKLESETIQYQEAKTYFKPTNKGNKLRDELQDKIDKAEAKVAKKKEKTSELKRLIRDIKAGGEEE
ncbi:MAG: DUF349 domain-containing protein [Balneolaceae bacterium]|nr:DUF349 domain-containing protein [Balneolaceae bacterium]MBO6545191.1 DUF349 domain-containing protein [Balneolaceae bacterium]MBO6646587.1 DUF349 domain-containing protein [Balneolaceae bacterium]